MKTQKSTVGTVNSAHRKRWQAGYHVTLPVTLPSERQQTRKCRGKPEARLINTATGVVYIKARRVPLKWWIMSQETSKLWLEKKRSCWVTVAVWWGGDALALQHFPCTGRSVTCCLCASKGGRRPIFSIINWVWSPNRSFRLVCTRSFKAKQKCAMKIGCQVIPAVAVWWI